jgi:hypothetical protein
VLALVAVPVAARVRVLANESELLSSVSVRYVTLVRTTSIRNTVAA